MDPLHQFNDILAAFRIKAECINTQRIDGYAFYDLRLLPNAKVKDIIKCSDEISLALKMPGRPSVKILHQQGVVRLEFALSRTQPLRLFDLFANDDVPEGNLICLLGQKVDGQKVWMDLAQNPHTIIAGTTGSGKSTLLHNIIGNMFNYNDCELFLVDPKNIEFHQYNQIGNISVSYTYDETLCVVDGLVGMMESRYKEIRGGKPATDFPYILLMIDEFADLIMQDKDDLLFTKLCQLAQKCRAARMCIILSTQRPSANIINGAIKANFPARIACRVATHVDSKVVLDTTGAEHLLGMGDALLRDNFRYMERFQVAYTDPTEVCAHFKP
jgi:S-DNA-T family DNA segregation ATPase FtsK/SpoIIIE